MWEVSEISPKAEISLDYRIILHYQLTGNILLTAEIYNQHGDYLTSVEVKGKAEDPNRSRDMLFGLTKPVSRADFASDRYFGSFRN